MQTLPWLIVLALAAIVVPSLIVWAFRIRGGATQPLPGEWALAPRPVFSTDERRVYRQLREALPHHIVLAKLPVVRFCQPTDPQEVRYWYELLGAIHVTFAICSANGRVLAAIDIDTDRGSSRRTMQIKQSVLNACRVRYLRCPVDHMPSIPELQLLVPQSGASARGPQPAPTPPRPSVRPREASASHPAARHSSRPALWQDSNFFQDSFFGPDTRSDDFGSSEFSSATKPPPSSGSGSGGGSSSGGGHHVSRQSTAPTSSLEPRDPLDEGSPDDIAGIVIDSAKYTTRH
jgi:uncharacterized membrane protein YgcG